MSKRGLFVGITTLDLVYLAPHFPQANEKLSAVDSIISAGGPATNASVTFSVLGNQSRLLSVLGNHPITQLIRSELKEYEIEHLDLQPDWEHSPPTSSIIVTENSADRAVISLNTARCQAESKQIPDNILNNVDLVLIDGHQMAVGSAISQRLSATHIAQQADNIPVVIDGGSWKEGWETVLPFTAKDTLGAGDIFHGAFCHYILQEEFTIALSNAAKIAAQACESFGTRNWINPKRNSLEQ